METVVAMASTLVQMGDIQPKESSPTHLERFSSGGGIKPKQNRLSQVHLEKPWKTRPLSIAT